MSPSSAQPARAEVPLSDIGDGDRLGATVANVTPRSFEHLRQDRFRELRSRGVSGCTRRNMTDTAHFALNWPPGSADEGAALIQLLRPMARALQSVATPLRAATSAIPPAAAPGVGDTERSQTAATRARTAIMSRTGRGAACPGFSLPDLLLSLGFQLIAAYPLPSAEVVWMP